MNKDNILLLYKYNQWSTAKILNAASNLTSEEFLAPGPFPHGGLRGTLVHALFAEWIWRSRWEGTSPTVHLKPEDFPTFESLRTRWAEEEKRLMAFVDDLTDENLNTTFDYTSTEGKPYSRILWQAMAHVVNHGTQHKTEPAAILWEITGNEYIYSTSSPGLAPVIDRFRVEEDEERTHSRSMSGSLLSPRK